MGTRNNDIRPIGDVLGNALASLGVVTPFEPPSPAPVRPLRLLTQREQDDDVRRRIAEREELHRKKECILRMRERNVPEHPGIRAVALAESQPNGAAIESIMWFLAERKRLGPHMPLLLAVLGDTDSGKTSAAARAIVHHPDSAYYVRAQMVPEPSDLFQGISFDVQAEVHYLRKKLRQIDLLVIDEMSTERVASHITELCCLRFDAGRATILVGNVKVETFGEIYNDKRFLTRLGKRQPYEAGTMLWIHDTQMSRRSTP